MKPFVFMLGPDPWPPGTTALQVYALIDLDENPDLAALIRGCREVAAAYPITVVDDRWLHVTLEQVTDQHGQDIAPADRRKLADALRARLAATAPFAVTAGSPIANRAGILLDLHPDDDLARLHREIRAAVHEVRGPGSTDYPVLPAHLTLAYAREETDSDAVQSKLRRSVRPSHARLGVDAVHLVEVRPDLNGKQITWDEQGAVTIPLGGRPAGT